MKKKKKRKKEEEENTGAEWGQKGWKGRVEVGRETPGNGKERAK